MPAIDLCFNPTKIASVAPKMATPQKRHSDTDSTMLQPCRSFLNAQHPLKKRRLLETASGPMLTPLVIDAVLPPDEDTNDLTNLNWLQDSDLLKKFYSDGLDANKNSSIVDPDKACAQNEKSPAEVQVSHENRLAADRSVSHLYCKPPYSYSTLIYMAIESAPSKSMMVRDIYKWIVTNFPYFTSAPPGWKNTIRHTLSLRKCFKKVERYPSGSQSDHSADSDGDSADVKGGYWFVDGNYRQSLQQLVDRTHQNSLPKLVKKQGPQGERRIPSLSLPHAWPNRVPTISRLNSRPLIHVPLINSFAKHNQKCTQPSNNNVVSGRSTWQSSNPQFKFQLSFGPSIHSRSFDFNSGIRRNGNAVSVISVNNTPKVYAPMPIVTSCPFQKANLTTMVSEKKLNLIKTENLSRKDFTLSPHPFEHKSTSLNRNQITILRFVSGTKSDSLHSAERSFGSRALIGANPNSKSEFEADDDELIRDGAEALLNFASGAFQLNDFIKQED